MVEEERVVEEREGEFVLLLLDAQCENYLTIFKLKKLIRRIVIVLRKESNG